MYKPTMLRTLVLGVALLGAHLAPASAAPATRVAPKPKPAVKTPLATAKDAFATAVAADLKRIAVGNQGGLLKVYDRSRREVVFYRGLDDQRTAPVSAQDRAQVYRALPVTSNLDTLADTLLRRYATLPKKEALALLGVIGSAPSSEIAAPSPATRARLLPFLVQVMRSDRDPINRRQALLALSLTQGVDEATVREVVRYYEVTDNLWVTFPVQQFFAYQATTVKRMPDYPAVWSRLSAVNSLYHDNVLASLK